MIEYVLAKNISETNKNTLKYYIDMKINRNRIIIHPKMLVDGERNETQIKKVKMPRNRSMI